MKLGELLAVAREMKGWSQRELEKRSKVDHAIIAQMETGGIKSPSWKNVVKLAKALNLKLDRLATLEDEEEIERSKSAV